MSDVILEKQSHVLLYPRSEFRKIVDGGNEIPYYQHGYTEVYRGGCGTGSSLTHRTSLAVRKNVVPIGHSSSSISIVAQIP